MGSASMQNRTAGTSVTYNGRLEVVVQFQTDVVAFLLEQGILQFLALVQVAYQE